MTPAQMIVVGILASSSTPPPAEDGGARSTGRLTRGEVTDARPIP